MKYASQSNKPDWYRSDDTKLYHSATSGSSPFNEWYEFDDRAEALELFADEIKLEKFCWLGGEIFHTEDLTYDEISEGFIRLEKAQPADLDEVVQSVSRF
jgi:hypothetical protein